MKRDFTKILDISKDEGMNLLERARYLKDIRKKGIDHKPLKGKNIAMIFEKASTRTRVSFEVGIHDLGGNAVIMNANDMQLGRGEPVKDTARVLSRYVDAVMIRTYKQTVVDELANWASIPIINGLSDLYHPCQILSDLYTISEFRGSFENLKIIYIGDGNNVANSWIEASILFDLNFAMATPNNYKPLEKLVKMAEKKRIEDAWEITPEAVAGYLKTLPSDEIHCSELAVGAFYLALRNIEDKSSKDKLQ